MITTAIWLAFVSATYNKFDNLYGMGSFVFALVAAIFATIGVNH